MNTQPGFVQYVEPLLGMVTVIVVNFKGGGKGKGGSIMFLCYKCYSLKYKEDHWEDFKCNTEVRNKCEECGLIGLFVRDILQQKEINSIALQR